METLFSAQESERARNNAPLAVRMRPATLDEYVGQKKAVGPGSWLRSAIEHDVLSSVILYGPAGTGKTTLAHIIAQHTRSEFVEVSAVTGTVKDLRREIDEAKRRLMAYDRRTILFIDEIHRFSRSQQDALLHAVENRTVIMIGATTENPYFEVNSALLSRARVVELEHLTNDEVAELVRRALTAPQGLAGGYRAADEVVGAICTLAAGDARAALTTLELASEMALIRSDGAGVACDSDGEGAGAITITLEDVRMANPRRGLSYDKSGDMHYDIISAFIKSMRGSDPDATVYWLARMIDAGEDPKFIARRIMIQASEDIGNADPQAFLVAEAAFKAAEVIGYPECRINLAQAAIYNALAPKSNACEAAIDAALADVHSSGQREVPSHLRDRHRPGSDAYGPYRYPHDYPEGWVDQQYLPDGLARGAFWKPAGRGWEQFRFEQSARDRSGRAPEAHDGEGAQA
ncbi:replication-associated recombination protein A [Collinsella sp. An268]|uniref:replication-associated recombination protein A n=1 Tax=Collinsella sp. An268 TaxID=1965612 RepID=UPI000B3A9F82|nr:replication-associated recombination protein A [Collinsella sp. An268]OUO65438.1 AAA family ATPase [Collinsella sp. An268]